MGQSSINGQFSMAMWNNQRVSLSCAVRIYPNMWKIPCHQTSMTCPSPSTGFQHSLHSFSPTCRKVPQTILCTQAQHAMFHAVSLAEQREKGIKKPTKAVETPPFLAHGPMDFHGVYWCFVCLPEGNWWQPGSQNPHEGFCQLIAFPLRQKIGGSSKKYPSGEQSIYIYTYNATALKFHFVFLPFSRWQHPCLHVSVLGKTIFDMCLGKSL